MEEFKQVKIKNKYCNIILILIIKNYCRKRKNKLCPDGKIMPSGKMFWKNG